MFLLNIAICDDEHQNRVMYYNFLLLLEMKTKYTFQTMYFSNGESLINYYKNHSGSKFHIILLDIEMPGINGIDTAKFIRQLPDREVGIIFLTAYSKYMMESFDVQPFQYLVKPISYDLFEQKVQFLCDYILSLNSKYLCTKFNGEITAIKYNDIIAIESNKEIPKGSLSIVTFNNEFIVRDTLEHMLTELPECFVAIHRSTLINLSYIKKFTSCFVLMIDGRKLPIGRTKLKMFKQRYTQYLTKEFKFYE